MVPTLLVVGSLNVDSVTTTESGLPRPGETLSGTSNKRFQGGKGANQAVAAAKIQTPSRVRMVGAVGTDQNGTLYLEHLAAHGVDSQYVVRRGEQTGFAAVAVDGKSGENTVIVVPGANALLETTDLDVPGVWSSVTTVLCQNEIPLSVTQHTFQVAKTQFGDRITTVWNPAPAPRSGVDVSRILKYVDVLCVNESEALVLSGQKDGTELEKCIQLLRDQVCRFVIITLGSRGCMYVSKEASSQVKHIPPFSLEHVQDTTGAGDCFCGVLCAILSTNQLDLDQALEVSNEAAARSTLALGAQTSYPSRSSLTSRSQAKLSSL